MGVANDFCTCKYRHCLHGENKRLLKSEAVRVGNSYYHPDCYDTKQTVAEIIDYFTKEINPDVVYMVLMKTINNIVFPKDRPGVSAERLLFQLKYYCTHGYKIKYPGGIYYAIQNRDAFEAYKKYKAQQAMKIKNPSFKIDDEQNKSKEGVVLFKKPKGFEDIVKGE